MHGLGNPPRIRSRLRADSGWIHALRTRLEFRPGWCPGFAGTGLSPRTGPQSSLTRMSLPARTAVILIRALGPSVSPYGRSHLTAE